MTVQRKESSFDILKLANSNTPDFNDLNVGPLAEYPVFIVGQLKSDGIYNQMLEDCKYYGPATTWGEGFILKEGPFGNYKYTPEPLIFELGLDPREKQKTLKEYESARDINWELAGRLRGEVYGVPLRTLTALDRWENNNEDAHREWKYITLDNPLSDTNSLRAYIWLSDWSNYETYFKSYKSLDSCPFRMEKSVGSSKILRSYYFQQPEIMYDYAGHYDGDY
jgi:hypothetical protein